MGGGLWVAGDFCYNFYLRCQKFVSRRQLILRFKELEQNFKKQYLTPQKFEKKQDKKSLKVQYVDQQMNKVN